MFPKHLDVSCPCPVSPPHWGSYEAVEWELSAKWTSRGKPSRQFFAWEYPTITVIVETEMYSNVTMATDVTVLANYSPQFW